MVNARFILLKSGILNSLDTVTRMARKSAVIFLFAFICSNLLPIAISSGVTFQRIDEKIDQYEMAEETMIFQRCSLNSTCNFVVKRTIDSNFEERHAIDDIASFISVWKKNSN